MVTVNFLRFFPLFHDYVIPVKTPRKVATANIFRTFYSTFGAIGTKPMFSTDFPRNFPDFNHFFTLLRRNFVALPDQWKIQRDTPGNPSESVLEGNLRDFYRFFGGFCGIDRGVTFS